MIALRPAAGGTARAPGIAESDGRAVVASLTDEGIGASAALAIVPFDAGRVSIALNGRGAPVVKAHLFGGGAISVASEVERDRSVISATITAPDGTPVEWIEVQFGAEGIDSP